MRKDIENNGEGAPLASIYHYKGKINHISGYEFMNDNCLRMGTYKVYFRIDFNKELNKLKLILYDIHD